MNGCVHLEVGWDGCVGSFMSWWGCVEDGSKIGGVMWVFGKGRRVGIICEWSSRNEVIPYKQMAIVVGPGR